jgi:hypothetical protein
LEGSKVKRRHPPIPAFVVLMTLSAVVAVSQESVTNHLGIDRTALPVPVDGFDDVTAGVFREGRVDLISNHGFPLDEALVRGVRPSPSALPHSRGSWEGI